MATTFADDVVIRGNVYVGGIIPLGGAGAYITDALISPTAAIQASKVLQQRVVARDLQNYGSAPVAVQKTLLKVLGASPSFVSFRAGIIQPLTVGSLTVDLLKNGVSVLSAAISLTTGAGTGGTAFDSVAGTITGTVAQNDVLEAKVTVSGPTGGGGLYCELVLNESPQ